MADRFNGLTIRFDLGSRGFEVGQLYCGVGTTESPGKRERSYEGQGTGILRTQGIGFLYPRVQSDFKIIIQEKLGVNHSHKLPVRGWEMLETAYTLASERLACQL